MATNIPLHYFMTLAMQRSMLWVGTGLMPANTKAAQRDDINYLGSLSGLMAQSPSDAGADEVPTRGDMETAKAFGVRIATVVRKLIKGLNGPPQLRSKRLTWKARTVKVRPVTSTTTPDGQ